MRLWKSACLVTLAVSGCATHTGARVMPETRFHYNEAVAVSSNEQILLNLVRMRFNHTVQFLEPTNVVTNWSITSNAGVGANTNAGDGVFTVLGMLSAGVSATESPTITYQPLSGERFVRLMAQPIGPELLLRLIQSGWEVDLVLRLTVDQINDLPAPWRPEEDDAFDQLLRRLTELQNARQLLVVLDATGAQLGLHPDADITELSKLLGVREDIRRLKVTGRRFERADDEVALGTRSLLGTLSSASLGVQVPTGEPTAHDPAGPEPPFLRVHVGEDVPSQAYVRVRYRDRWYWIDDTDLASKRTFSLLALLFSLMAAPDAAVTPMLTVPAGR